MKMEQAVKEVLGVLLVEKGMGVKWKPPVEAATGAGASEGRKGTCVCM